MTAVTDNWDKKQMIRLLLTVFMVMAAGFLADLFCQRAVLTLPKEEQGRFSAAIAASEGFTQTGEGWLLSEEDGSLTVELSGRYVGSFGFSYSYDERLNAVWYVWEPGAQEPLVLEDHNSALIQTSVERLDRRVERIEIRWDRENMTPLDGGDLAAEETERPFLPDLCVREFFYTNRYETNWHRAFFVWTVLGLGVFLWTVRRRLLMRIEVGFLAVSLSLGLLMIVLAPANKISWDEEVHFFHAYCVSFFGAQVRTNETLERLFVADKENYPYNLPANREERAQMNETLNRLFQEEEFLYSRGRALAGIYTPAYIPQALGLRLGFLLRLPFTVCYQLGRLFNLLFCACVMAWAIRRLPVGKGIACVTGLLPAPLFLMSMYSYDAFLTSLLTLGFAWFLSEYLEPEKKIGWFGFGVMALSFAVGSMPKAIYIPLILVIWLLPREKFADRRQEFLMKGAAACLFLALMASFVLPTALSPAETNDTRGGNTSEAGQIPYILSDIPRFFKLLVSSMCVSFPSYTMGASLYGMLGHGGGPLMGKVIPVLVLTVIASDEKRLPKQNGGRLTWPARLWILLLCAGIMAMVWLAMYLAFTPVGLDRINGVQPRYYIPLLLPLYLCLCPDRLRLEIRKQWVYGAAVVGSAAITLAAVYLTLMKLCG
ncbi:MAG: DUF2142 domain-containing protein [Lachnospiraceae bacterium]|jgi:uncharacterized membrane protein|nr:DUF2142 domain-containing protein [Lachnospiraceae bacterium]